jgi:signal recognition particle receptor subunit beta
MMYLVMRFCSRYTVAKENKTKNKSIVIHRRRKDCCPVGVVCNVFDSFDALYSHLKVNQLPYHDAK